jgi:signal transduction histidine kinase/DNA-binding response OmpR family regulator
VIPTVLLVDDRPANLLALEAALEPLQARLLKASSGREALSWLLKEDVALILLDVQMPDLDGFETAAMIRMRERTRYTPIIFVTAVRREEAQMLRGYAHGAIDYLVKPLDLTALHSKVRLLLEQYTREQNLREEALLRLRERDEMQKREHAALLHAEEQRARLHSLFMHAPTPIAILQGPDQVFELANSRFEALIGRKSILGRPGREVIRSETWDLLDEVYRKDEPFLATESPGLFGLEGRVFNFVAQPTHDPSGRVRGVMFHVVEVTAEVLARQKMEALAQELRNAGRSKDQFLAILGHELRNPLAPILTALHLMKVRSNAESSENERAIIERQARHLSRLVDDLLDVSRATMGKVDLRREPLEVSTAILRAVEVAGHTIEAKKHHLTVNAQGAGLVVAGDPVRLAQVISNLLTNAAKYTDPGGHIDVDARREGPEIVIRVRDDGRGIAKERLSTIFDLFVQGDQPKADSQGGLGVGLTLVRSLVQLHGGKVEAYSEGPARGSEFVVRLPALDEALVTTMSVRPPRERRGPNRSRRVLVVDDNVDTAELLTEALRQEGHEVAQEHDGLGALVAAASFRPDLILLDIGLPGIDGFEVTRRIRADPQFVKVRIVALTGYGQESDRAHTAAVGIDRHLIKPVEMETVLGAITALLEPQDSGKLAADANEGPSP